MNTVHDPTNGANIPRNVSNVSLKTPTRNSKNYIRRRGERNAGRDAGMGSGEDVARFGAETKGGRRKTTRNRVHSRVEMAGYVCEPVCIYMHACVHKDGA